MLNAMVLSAQQIRSLAPDAGALRAGEALANPARWRTSGRSATAVWGLCQGSAGAPNQVSVDLDGPAYRCSCPSRKIPCKHALGLLLVAAADGLTEALPPDWASDWLASRAARVAAAAIRDGRQAEPDEAARLKRAEARERKVIAGVEELDRWLGDLMRRGLDPSCSAGWQTWWRPA
jgi:hypothetical protein